MSVKTKDKLLQVRLEHELFERISAVADHHQLSVSALVRGYLLHQAQVFERRVVSNDQWAATLASRAAAADAAESVKKQPVEPVVASEGALARKRRLEKEAKQAKQAKREDRR